MFGPVRGAWDASAASSDDTPAEEDWSGWWGDDPPFHTPVFVLTHHPREPLEMQGGTTFHFVTDGIEAALERAADAARGLDVSLGGGADTARQYLRARLVDEMEIHVVPLFLGGGARLFENLDGGPADFECVGLASSAAVAHFNYVRNGPGDTASASRRHLIESSPGGLVSIAGGKLTTHRTIAVDVLRRLPAELRPRSIEMSNAPLPGTNLRGCADLLLRNVEPDLAAHLLGLYGGEARRLLAYAGAVPNALDRIHADAPDVVAQVHFARDEEFALTVDDVVGRRTTLAVRGLTDRSVTRQIADIVLDHDAAPGTRTSTSREPVRASA